MKELKFFFLHLLLGYLGVKILVRNDMEQFNVDTVLNFSEAVKHTSSTQETVADKQKRKPLTATFNKNR